MGSVPGLSRSYILRSNLARVPQLLSQHSSPHELQWLKPVRLKPILENNMLLIVTATRIMSIVLSLFLRKYYLWEPAVQVYYLSENNTRKHIFSWEYCWCCLVAKSCLTLGDPMDYISPGSSDHGLSQGRTLQWVAISFSRGYSRPREWTHVSWIGRWILYYWTTREVLPKNTPE